MTPPKDELLAASLPRAASMAQPRHTLASARDLRNQASRVLVCLLAVPRSVPQARTVRVGLHFRTSTIPGRGRGHKFSGLEKIPVPELEHEHAPQGTGTISAASHVLVQQRAHGLLAEIAALLR